MVVLVKIWLSLKLLVNKDKIIEINKQSHSDLFKATCGGMGLTDL